MAIKLGLDAKRAFNNHSGLGVYSRGVIEELAKNLPCENLVLFTPKRKIWHSSLTTITSRLGALWRSFVVYFDLLKYDIEVYHGLAGELPFFIPKKVKTVVTIHDLLFLRFPQDYPSIDRVIYHHKAKYACRKADKIIAVSEVTKQEIIRFYHIDEEKIEVIPVPISDKILHKQEKPYHKDYIVCISSFIGRKNQDVLVKAFAKIKDQVTYDLIFIGGGKRKNEIIHLSRKMKCETRIQFLSKLTDTEKFNYLDHSLFSAYPSRGEGFGIPILESFLYNKPIILSDTPIHREVADEAGIYFRDNDVGDLAEKLLVVPTLIKHNFTELAQQRIANFQAEDVAIKLKEIYFSLIDRTPRI
ncbi:MAG: glycosyltransferase family 4 protein [Chitinophagales bacterium]|nr:glycosyltransferase family 4 protein [Chitinophagales bacterium]